MHFQLTGTQVISIDRLSKVSLILFDRFIELAFTLQFSCLTVEIFSCKDAAARNHQNVKNQYASDPNR
jgi:hypothetical protein